MLVRQAASCQVYADIRESQAEQNGEPNEDGVMHQNQHTFCGFLIRSPQFVLRPFRAHQLGDYGK